uniref:O-acetylhomoserine aminocarboxypropyltransferase n=1 Tax=Hemiselmis andersenii TaxID=464988 RepID=A0A7S1DJL5_HEMAN
MTWRVGIAATCTSCGHSAQMMVFYALCSTGDKIIASNKLYGGTVTQLSRTIKKFGFQCDFVDVSDTAAVKAALAQPNVKALFIESLCNPGGVVTDIAALAALTSEVHVPLVVDNTLATPYLCRPIEHGANIVVHSLTKYMCGHGNAMGGAIVDAGKFDWAKVPGKYPSMADDEPAYHGLNFSKATGPAAFTYFCIAVGLRDLGPQLAPMNAFLIMMGIETLPLRMDRHCSNALAVAQWLEKHKDVESVSYPTLPGNKYNALADKYISGKGGAVLTFSLKKGHEACSKVADNCQLFSNLANLGDTRSLIIHPSSTTHSQLTDDQKKAAGAEPNTLRLCVGIENVEDLIADLDRAIANA